MKAHQAEFPIATMCRVPAVSRSGYYAWLERPPSARAQQDERLTARIKQIHEQSRGTYGAPRIHADLADEGIHVGRKRVARLMKAAGGAGISRRRRVCTTRRSTTTKAAADLVNRAFTAAGPDELWLADITYVPTWQGFLFLAVVVDVWSRRVVGWAMADHLRTDLVLDALEMALGQRQPQAVIHHSDQGSQYTALAFGQRCQRARVRPSTGSVGDCYDNALCESFFATLECDLLERCTFRTRAEARLACFEFIEGWYNPQRRHSALAYQSPMQFERSQAQILAHATP